ncbi:MAG: M20 family metallopeptidase [Gammaproteobacteria bacterium]|nr:M20 family metallopeptidase [Gammaproteobacteria bacterium]MBU1505683.1 M20 family metallopeptidase [Gammaproteobacteria bacterium]MBU2123068.1 M20 family metallopeptidase [Gammaproteobacteria bacterium]MBU2170915.1 M20 family metallopeptidase [Gammaproteobacteria bacterium]MBU2200930.1 M20 family metallopeptidase [Gammaproteobacteria bacterium]
MTLTKTQSRPQLIDDVRRYFDDGRFAADLRRRVAWRTESDTGQVVPALRTYLTDEVVPWLKPLGFDCQVVDNPDPPGGPLLLARRVEDPALPTVLTYGHGDVVNGQDSAWREGLSPWELTIEDDRWYGRGTADNKGQHTISLAALAHTLEARQGRLGYNVTLLMEMGEEAGSPGLAAFCEQHRDALKAELFVASDGPRVNSARPTLFLGSRGAINFSLTVRSRDKAYHSGNWGGVLANPATVLTHALATLVDPKGRILVKGLLPPTVPSKLRAALQDVVIGTGTDDPALTPGWGEPGLTPAEQLVGWNTLEVLALGAGNAQRPINAIPSQAVAHCQLRFVVGTDWHNVEAIVREHLDAHGFADVAITLGMVCGATRLDLHNPWVDWALASLEASAGQAATLLPNLAGSLPNDIFADQLGLPTLWVPHSYPACAQHAPNEHLLGSVAREGLAVMAGLFWDLGEAQGTPWKEGRLAAAA